MHMLWRDRIDWGSLLCLSGKFTFLPILCMKCPSEVNAVWNLANIYDQKLPKPSEVFIVKIEDK